MISKIVFGFSLIVILLGLMSPVQSVKVNITNFEICQNDQNENLDHFVTFSDITYECNAEKICDTIHGKYNIPTINDNDKLINITMFRCGPGTTGPCSQNSESFYEVMECERFHIDETGPWAMFSQAMAGASRCGAEAGTFDLKNARLKSSYLTDFMAHDVNFPRHRMKLMLRKIHGNTDDTILRTCIYVDFDVIFD